jgi:hypothetical protein
MISDEPIFDKVLAQKRRQGWTYAQLTTISGLSTRQIRLRIQRFLHGPR